MTRLTQEAQAAIDGRLTGCAAGPVSIGQSGNATSAPWRLPEPTITRDKRSPMTAYTDEEIAAEYHRRALRKLGDPRVGVSGGALEPGEISTFLGARKD
jgi:hypothetical protein